ncbi:NUDIX domain-containing protein [Aurantivibrio infirmus]
MPIDDPTYNNRDVEIIERDAAYSGFFRLDKISLRHKLFAGGWSESIHRELFVRGEAVAIILYDPANDLVGLIEQFRIGALEENYGPWCLEVVAGMVESGESSEQVAVRELKEEANVTADKFEYICNYLSSPGGTDEKLHLYCGFCDLSNAGGVYGLPSEGEDIRVCVFPAQEVFGSLLDGRFNNAATLICLQWLQLNHSRLRQ